MTVLQQQCVFSEERFSQSGTVIKFDNVVTSQHGVDLEFGEFSERGPSLRQFFGCVRTIYPELQVINVREQGTSSS